MSIIRRFQVKSARPPAPSALLQQPDDASESQTLAWSAAKNISAGAHARAMAGLPRQPVRASRRFKLWLERLCERLGLAAQEHQRLESRLKKLQEEYGLDSNNSRRLYSPEKREEVRKQRIEKRDKNFYDISGTQFSDRWTGVPIHGTRAVRPRDPKSTSWQQYVQIMKSMPQSSAKLGRYLSKMDPFAALLVDSAIEPVEYLIKSFDAIAGTCFPGGSKASKPYEDFIASLGEIERMAIKGCLALWPRRADWVQRVVVPAARDRLNGAVAIWRGRAGLPEKQPAEKPGKLEKATKPRGRPRMENVPSQKYKAKRTELAFTQPEMAQLLRLGKKKGVKKVHNAEHGRASKETREAYERKFPDLISSELPDPTRKNVPS